ncbi:MAG TPA: hypothetical protein VEU06_02160 [Micropepsaceae bacterium]|nr:hypothetical protein [Micropepsaceae bacterium]
MWRSVIMSSLVVALLGSGARLETSHAATRNISNQDFFVMFFVPGSKDISPEARWIVEQAAASAKAQEASAIEIALSSGTSRRASLSDMRAAAIEKVLSAEGPEIHFVRRPLSKSEISIPGAEDRAEIRIVQR